MRRAGTLVVASWVAGVGIVASGTLVAAKEFVVNGSFETDAVRFSTVPGYVGGNNPEEIPGWIGNGGRGINFGNPSAIADWHVVGSAGLNPVQDANRSVPFRDNGANDSSVLFLQGTSQVSRIVSGLIPGANYVLGFEFNSRDCCGDSPVPTLSLDGQAIPDFFDPGTFPDGVIKAVGVANPWYSSDLSFTAQSATVEIGVGSRGVNNGDATLLLDNFHLYREGTTANLMRNGDFENEAEAFTQWPGYVGGGVTPFRDNGNNYSAVAFLQGSARIEQELTDLTPGREYLLSFEYNARNCCGDVPLAEIQLNGLPLPGFPPDNHLEGVQPVGGNRPWYRFEKKVVAETTNVLLSIASLPTHGGDASLAVDNVSFRTGNAGDFDENGILDAADIDSLNAEVRRGTNEATYDVNSDGKVNALDSIFWVEGLKKTYFGDANFDGVFNTTDFVSVFQAGQYEDQTATNSTWSTGDWNGDAEFNSGDFVVAFQGGGFESGPRATALAIPEPSAVLLTLSGLVLFAVRRHRVPRFGSLCGVSTIISAPLRASSASSVVQSPRHSSEPRKKP